MNRSGEQVDFKITGFLDGFQKNFHVKLAIWTGDGQKLCEKSALIPKWPDFHRLMTQGMRGIVAMQEQD